MVTISYVDPNGNTIRFTVPDTVAVQHRGTPERSESEIANLAGLERSVHARPGPVVVPARGIIKHSPARRDDYTIHDPSALPARRPSGSAPAVSGAAVAGIGLHGAVLHRTEAPGRLDAEAGGFAGTARPEPRSCLLVGGALTKGRETPIPGPWCPYAGDRFGFIIILARVLAARRRTAGRRSGGDF